MLRDSCLIKELTSVADANKSFEWGSGKEADSIRTLTSQEMVVSVQNILKGHNLEEGVWVFGYGPANVDSGRDDWRSDDCNGY